MADLTTMVAARSVNVPGLANSVVRAYSVTLLSAADTLKVPALHTRSATADQSSIRVLNPATGVTVTAGAIDANGEHTLTFGGSGAADGVKVTFVALHATDRVNS